MIELTQEIAKDIFTYNARTGEISWNDIIDNKYSRKNKKIWKNNKGYLFITFCGKIYPVHRVIWIYCFGREPKNIIDHINRNTSDNRLVNLREATTGENLRNKGMYKSNSSGVNGVHFSKDKKKWRAMIRFNKKLIHLGYFKDLELAIERRKAADIEYGFSITHGLQST